MAEITVKQLAEQTKKDPSILLKQLKSFGIDKSDQKDILTAIEMKTLLENINNLKKAPIRRKVSVIKLDSKHKINVSVKRKRQTINKIQQSEPILAEAEQNKEAINQDSQVIAEKQQSNLDDKVEKTADVIEQEVNVQEQQESKNNTLEVSGFKITSMPENRLQLANQGENKSNADSKHARKKATKKTFADSLAKTRYKKEEEKRIKTRKDQGKAFKKANPRQLSQLADDLDCFDEFGIRKSRSLKIKTQEFTKPVEDTVRVVDIYEGITAGDIAQKMAVKAAEVVKVLFNMGVMVTINQSLDQDTAILVVEEMGHKYTLRNENALEEAVAKIDRSTHKRISRAAVVTIMGHVDHGKTSLLDYIRNTRVVNSEAGSITQHIGAYAVKTKKGSLTFLDTPGHEAFTSMRARGAKITDIVILVVAADDGVMPQTQEAIQHAKAAGVPIVVAVNKIDKPEADADKVINELAQRDVVPESWGGDVMFVNVSAKTGQGIPELLDAVLLQSEVLELEAFDDGIAEGVIIESRIEKGRGPIATTLIQNGRLNQGDVILCGKQYGRVRAMYNDLGQQVKVAGPSSPVEILGLSGVAIAGDEMIVVEDDKKAREVAVQRTHKQKEAKAAQQQALKLSNMFSDMDKSAQQQTLRVILKCDVQGSVEAIKESLNKLSTQEVKVDIVASGTGGITSSDVSLALASQAVMIGFNVRADAAAKKLAQTDGVELRYYNIIYDLIDDVKKAMTGLLSPEMKEQIIGIAEVREVYRSSKFGLIAGCMVTEGLVKITNPIRVIRDDIVIYEGSLESLKRFKDDASKVKKGLECGIGVKNYNDVRAGDKIEVFEVIEVAKEL